MGRQKGNGAALSSGADTMGLTSTEINDLLNRADVRAFRLGDS